MNRVLPAMVFAAFALSACGGDKARDNDKSTSNSAADVADELTLDTCSTSIGADVPPFFKDYFKCVDISVSGDEIVIHTNGLPPHKSYYFGEGSPNFAEFDTSRGSEYRPNPNQLREQTVTLRIP